MGRISELINRYTALGCDRFHTPGHKGELCLSDITELGIGGEIFPADAVEKAQADTASLYGVKHLRYLTGGSSMGVKAAVGCFVGKKILYAAGVHRAFTEACELFGVTAVPTSGEHGEGLVYNCACGFLPAPITVQEADSALKKHPDAAAMFITSPDYLGRVADIRLADLCRQKGVALIADSAHGAHFAFAPELGKYRFETVADMCNMSSHKTLGAYTQSALLAVNNGNYVRAVDRNLKLLGTTSPNYVMFARLEDSAAAAKQNCREYLRLKKFSEEMRSCVECMPNTDYTRICIKAHGDPKKAFADFVARKIMPEAVIGEYVVFILTPADSDGKLGRLRDAATKIKAK